MVGLDKADDRNRVGDDNTDIDEVSSSATMMMMDEEQVNTHKK